MSDNLIGTDGWTLSDSDIQFISWLFGKLVSDVGFNWKTEMSKFKKGTEENFKSFEKTKLIEELKGEKNSRLKSI